MPTSLTTHAREQGTYIITVAFTDEDGAAVVPTAITWSLLDGAEAIINSRSDEVIAVPAASITIVLSGNDLPSGHNFLYLLVEWTYNSSLGNNLPGKETVSFQVDDLVGVG